jgi:hypothetical protein
MDNTQKGILISSDSLTWKQLEFGYSVTREFVGNLAAADIDYVYVAERGNEGGYFTGYVGRIRKITITPAANPDNRIYSFELSKLLKPSISTGQLQFNVRGKKNGEIINWDFEKIFADAEASEESVEKLHENPAKAGLPPLSIREATVRLADTYGIDPGKITISITG